MKKEFSQTDVRKRTLHVFCRKFLREPLAKHPLSIADIEVKAVKGLEQYLEEIGEKDFSGETSSGLRSYLQKYSLSSYTLNKLYAAGYEAIVRLSYSFHGKKYYTTESHLSLNEKLQINL